MSITIRPSIEKDFNDIWEIFSDVIKGQDTFVFPPNMSYGHAKQYWMDFGNKVYVAEHNNEIVGTYMLKPIHSGNGNHIGNASYMVSSKFRGKSVGKLMGQHCIEESKKLGYSAIQYNMVVSTNTVAVKLWKSLGFKIIATIPGGFRHRTKGFVDSYVMFKTL
jgi:L-amino acid N-acyltransferase YncA